MSNILPFSLALINSFFFIRDFNKGVVIFFIICFIGPNFILFNHSITYELFFGLFLIVAFLMWMKNNTIRISAIHILLLLYFLILVISTAISINKYYVSTELIALLGTGRIILFIVILTQFSIRDNKTVEKIIFPVLIVNVFFSFIQIIFPSSIKVFAHLYGKESLIPLLYYADIGFLNRAVGSFGSPINLGAFALLCLAYFWGKILAGYKTKINMVGLCLSIICGLLSCTKTFLFGSPIIIICGFLVSLLLGERIKMPRIKQVLFFLLFTSGAILIGGWTYSFAIARGIPLNYYFGLLSKPLQAFNSRYNTEEGILSLTRFVIEENPIMGVGKTIPFGEFIGDSFYFVLIHDTGILGTIIFGLIFIVAVVYVVKQKSLSKILMLLVLVLSGFAFDPIFNLFGVITFAYLHQSKKI